MTSAADGSDEQIFGVNEQILVQAKATKKRRRPTGSAAQFRGRQRPQIGTNGTRCQIDIVRPTEAWSSSHIHSNGICRLSGHRRRPGKRMPYGLFVPEVDVVSLARRRAV